MPDWKSDLKKMLSTKAWKVRKFMVIAMILLGVMIYSLKFYVEQRVEEVQANAQHSILLDTDRLENLTKNSARK